MVIFPRRLEKGKIVAIRVLWDKFETALLIDAWLSIEAGKLSRQSAVITLSEQLRNRAKSQGMNIDDVFRNENGISMQLNNVQRLMNKEPGANQHNTKIFIDMVEMYFTDRTQFREILQEAKGCGNQVRTKEELFADWLSANVSRGHLSEYFLAIADVEEYAKSRKLISSSIYDVTDPEVSAKIVNLIDSDRIFRYRHKKQIRSISEVARLFHKYTRVNKISGQPQGEEKPEAENGTEDSAANEQMSSSVGEIPADRVPNESSATEALAKEGSATAQSETGLQSSSVGESVSDGATDFSNWLISSGFTERAAKDSAFAVSTASDYAKERGISNKSFFEIDNDELDAAWERLQADDGFIKLNKEQYNRFSAAVHQYVSFRKKGLEEEKVPKEEKAPVTPVATSTASKVDLQAEFKEWMRSNGINTAGVKTYTLAIVVLSEMAAQCLVTSKPLFRITEPSELLAVWNRLKANRQFQEWFRGNTGDYLTAIRGYDKFLKARKNHGIIASSRRDAVESSSRGHPCQKEFESWLLNGNTPRGSARTYANAVRRIGDYLLREKKEDRHVYSIFGVARLEKIKNSIQNDSHYAESVRSSNPSLDLYALRKYIKFRRDDTPSDVDDVLYEQYSSILRDYFENGFRIGSMIDRNRFKQYYFDLFGEDVKQSDEEIVETLQRVGEIQDNRVFARDVGTRSDLLDDIQADIAKTFNQGASCVYITSVYERYQLALTAELKIYDESVLCEQLLTTCYGLYNATKQFFYIKGRKPDVALDIQKIMKQSPVPMSYEQIHETLWYIPLEQIKHSLVVTDGMVNVAQETYFFAPNLPISSTELESIVGLIHAQLVQKSYVTDSELRDIIQKNYPSISINTEGFTTWGLRNSLAYLLRGRFSFNGPIISELGQKINMSQAFEDFCNSHDVMMLSELRDFAKEMNTVIYWDAVFAVMTRLSHTEFVKRGSVSFDVERTDEVLCELVEGDYIPLKSVKLFLHFPSLSVKWNEFVLESYVAQYSEQFALLHASYTATECCGAIVRKDSGIRSFKDLVVRVLANSGEWSTTDDALSLLVREGYLQQRRYSDIVYAVPEAKVLRETYIKRD